MSMSRLKLFVGVFAVLAWSLPAVAQGQQAFAGTLSDSLRAQAAPPAFFFVRHIRLPRRDYRGVKPLRGDEFFVGVIPLPRGARLRYQTLLVRHSDGSSTLWVDANRDGNFEPVEGVPFRPDPRSGAVARFRVDLPTGNFRPLVMQAFMAQDYPPPSAQANRIRLGYTSSTCVPGRVDLRGRMLGMCFEYDPATGQTSLARGLEWVNGGRILRPHGRPPVFRIGNLTLQAATLDVKTRAFVLVSLPASAGLDP